MILTKFADSLKKAFGDRLELELVEDELKIVISGKTAWINGVGELTGEASGISAAALQIGVDISSVVISSARAAIMPGI